MRPAGPDGGRNTQEAGKSIETGLGGPFFGRFAPKVRGGAGRVEGFYTLFTLLRNTSFSVFWLSASNPSSPAFE